MALTGLHFSEEYEYVSERDPANKETIEASREAGATIFTLGSLPADIRSKINDGIMSFENITAENAAASFSMNSNKQYLEAARYGIKGVENFRDPKGNLIALEFEDAQISGQTMKRVTIKSMGSFPNWLVSELGKEVLGANSVSGAERKNSNPQS